MKNAWRPFSALRALSRSPIPRPIFPSSQNPSFFPPFQASNRPFPSTIARLFSSNSPVDSIKQELSSLNPETIDFLIRKLGSMDKAENDEILKLNSKSYNRMITILGMNGQLEGLWGLVEIMRKKGFGISKSSYNTLSKSFAEAKLESEFAQFEKMYLSQCRKSEVGRDCQAICVILKSKSDDVRSELSGLGIVLSDDLVVAVLDRFCDDWKKALLFFRFVQEKHFCGSGVYNAMVRVLAREDSIIELWEVVRESRSKGYELEKGTYVKVSDLFCKKRLVGEAVDFYEFVMGGLTKPSNRDFVLLLKLIVTSKELDMKLVTRVVRAFTNDGNVVGRSAFVGVIKSLTSVGRLGFCDEVLKAMEDGGFAADSFLHDQVVIGLSKAGKMDRALEYLDNIEKEGYSLDSRTWTSLIAKHSLAGELELALTCLKRMIERRGVENVAASLEVFVDGFCQKDKVKELYKILKEMIIKRNVQPSHSTYKTVIKSLVAGGYLKEASDVLPLMKKHNFPPFIDPFIEYISKSGSVDDTMGFLKAMTVKEFPSKTLLLRVYETLLKAGRHDIAHGILSRSPGSVRNHADVLELFYSMKPSDATVAVA